MHRIFYIVDIARLVVFSLAEDARVDMLMDEPDGARHSLNALANLAGASKHFHSIVLEVLKVDLHDHKPLITLLRGLDGEADAQKYDAIISSARSIWFHNVDEWAASMAGIAYDPPTKLTLPVRELFYTFGFGDHNILDISALNLPRLREVCIRGVWNEEDSTICEKSSQISERLLGSLKPIVDSYKELETLRIRWDNLSLSGPLKLFKMFLSLRNLKHLELVLEGGHELRRGYGGSAGSFGNPVYQMCSSTKRVYSLSACQFS